MTPVSAPSAALARRRGGVQYQEAIMERRWYEAGKDAEPYLRERWKLERESRLALAAALFGAILMEAVIIWQAMSW